MDPYTLTRETINAMRDVDIRMLTRIACGIFGMSMSGLSCPREKE